MKKKLFLALALTVLTVSVAGCGIYGVRGQSTAGFINKNQISKIKPGASENYILARFGKPEEQNFNGVRGIEWTYCGNHKTNRTFLSVFHTTTQKNQCVIFRFNEKGRLVKTIVKTY